MINVDPQSFEISASGLITGRISIKINDVYFPEREWNDSVVNLLNWWAIELSNFFSGVSTSVNLYFMEGPLHVKLGHINNQSSVVFIHENSVVEKFEIEYNDLKSNALTGLLSSVEICLITCQGNGWFNKEIDELEKNRVKLKEKFANLGTHSPNTSVPPDAA